MLHSANPRLSNTNPYHVAGMYCTYEGDNEETGWSGAYQAFNQIEAKITNRKDGMTLGFLYRPHTDHPEISQEIKACFIGVDVAGFDDVPEGMATTVFDRGGLNHALNPGRLKQRIVV